MIEGLKENLGIQIVEASIEDVADIAAVHKQSCIETYVNSVTVITLENIEAAGFDSSKKIDLWRRRIESNDENHKIWVVRDGEKVVGFCYKVKQMDADLHNITGSIYILKEYQKLSIGKQLMAMVIEWFGNKEIPLWVWDQNQNAISFYRKLGFEFTDGEELWAPDKNTPQTTIRLVEMVRKAVATVVDRNEDF